MDVDATATELERRLERVDHPAPLRAAEPEAVLDHLEPAAAPCVYARIALLREQVEDLDLAEVGGHFDGKAHDQPRVVERRRTREEILRDALGRVPPHRRAAAAANEPRRPREKQLQVIVELGHRADGRTRGANRVRLVDGDGGRDSVDAIDPRFVHAIEELPGVWRESLDVATLTLGIDRVEHQRRLAGPGHARHHDQLAERKVEIECAQIVLARPSNADAVGRRLGHGTGGRPPVAGAFTLPRIARLADTA